MKNLKSKVRDFLNSEEGRVGVKAPLAVGVAASGLMFTHAVTSTPSVEADPCGGCPEGKDCVERLCLVILGLGPANQATWGIVPCFFCE